jgi:hypothetical protein
VTEIETGILMVAMLLGASIFSYTVSNATSFITQLEGRGGHNQKYMDHVSTFLVDCGLSKPLRVQIMNFFDKRLSRSHIALPKISEVCPHSHSHSHPHPHPHSHSSEQPEIQGLGFWV